MKRLVASVILLSVFAIIPVWWIFQHTTASPPLLRSLPIRSSSLFYNEANNFTALATTAITSHTLTVPVQQQQTRTRKIPLLDPQGPRATIQTFSYPISPNCSRSRFRDFQTNPVLILGGGYPTGSEFHSLRCDVPCFYSSDFGRYRNTADASLTTLLSCPDQYSVTFTMENQHSLNSIHSEQGYAMTVSLGSDVPVPYYGWSDFDIMRPASPKTGDAMASAFVSNCVPARKAIIEALIKEGISVHSFGACLHNKEEDSMTTLVGKYKRKIDILSKYKFHLAFENSVSEDYVTEKFFQSLVAGTIPVVYGAPNIHEYEPSNNSILSLQDFPTLSALATRMKEIASNSTLYNQMLAWKITGPKPSFLAAMDFTSVHSECRLCMKIADDYAKKYGEVSNRLLFEDEVPGINLLTSPPVLLFLFARERHSYYFRKLFLSALTMDSLLDAIATAFKGYVPLWARVREFDGTLRVFSVYRSGITAREALSMNIQQDEDVLLLKNETYVDVVFI